MNESLDALVLDALASGVAALDERRRIIAFNRSAEQTFGVPAAQLLGRGLDAFCELIPELDELLDTFFASGARQLRAEVDGVRRPSTALTLELQMSPLALQRGTGVAISIADRTKQRALEEAHAASLARSSAIEASFSRYLAPHLVRAVMENPETLRPGGTCHRATMLFADIRGFTAIAARLSPDRVVDLLNRYFEGAVNVVYGHDGLLDKFYGDGLLAVFGPPLVRDDDARRALVTALRLHGEVDRINPYLAHPIQISIGIATGDVIAGHLGSATRMDYTVIGDAVNLASGLQAAAPPGVTYWRSGHVHRRRARPGGRSRRGARERPRGARRRLHLRPPVRSFEGTLSLTASRSIEPPTGDSGQR